MKNTLLFTFVLISGCASSGRHLASVPRVDDTLTDGATYHCQRGLEATYANHTLSFRVPSDAKFDKAVASLTEGVGHTALDPNGFDADHSREPGFLATLVAADPGGAGAEAQLYKIGKDRFRLVPEGGSVLPGGECSR